jgi:hypothetical protein
MKTMQKYFKTVGIRMELFERLCTCLYRNAMLYWKLGNRMLVIHIRVDNGALGWSLQPLVLGFDSEQAQVCVVCVTGLVWCACVCLHPCHRGVGRAVTRPP